MYPARYASILLAAVIINKNNIAKVACIIQDLSSVELNDRYKVWMEGGGYSSYANVCQLVKYIY